MLSTSLESEEPQDASFNKRCAALYVTCSQLSSFIEDRR
jgi:hypothetical protein